MTKSGKRAALLFVLGTILLCWFFTPFIDITSGELTHTHITFVGKLLIGRLLLYIALLGVLCIGVAIGTKNLNTR